MPESIDDEVILSFWKFPLDHVSGEESNFTDSAVFINVEASVYRGYSKNDKKLSLTNELYKAVCMF
jgi:hypothetical protein